MLVVFDEQMYNVDFILLNKVLDICYK